jgi:hypothetical protein
MSEPRTLPALPGLEQTSFAFKRAILEAADASGFPADEIAAVMYSESKFDPTAYNKDGGAAGLIQFMPFVAEHFGTTTSAILAMSREDQMPLVARFYKGQKKPVLPGDTYVSTFLPAAVGKPDDFVLGKKDSDEPSLVKGVTLGKMYASNHGLDGNKDGAITVGDVRQKILGYLQAASKKPRLPTDGVDPLSVRLATQVGPRVKLFARLGVFGLAGTALYWYLTKR